MFVICCQYLWRNIDYSVFIMLFYTLRNTRGNRSHVDIVQPVLRDLTGEH
jgi:hypothetical protein